MTEKRYSSAKVQYNYYKKSIRRIGDELDKYGASLILSLPIGINYDYWRKLHQIKGDFE